MNQFEQFYEHYPRRTGIGAAGRAFHNQIMFKGADPDYMVKAAKAYKIKMEDTEEQFIQKPVTFLTDQTYLDDDLREIIERKEKEQENLDNIPEELRGLAMELGSVFYNAWLSDAVIEGNKIKVSQWKHTYLTTHHPYLLEKTNYELESE